MRPEEILFNKKPFALHMRTVKNIHRDANIENQQLDFLKKFIMKMVVYSKYIHHVDFPYYLDKI